MEDRISKHHPRRIGHSWSKMMDWIEKWNFKRINIFPQVIWRDNFQEVNVKKTFDDGIKEFLQKSFFGLKSNNFGILLHWQSQVSWA